jgi:hypothetical protein
MNNGQEFLTEAEAKKSLLQHIDDSCIDNYRFVYEVDDPTLEEYDKLRENGCWGSADFFIYAGGLRAHIGCNYGH